MHSHKILNFPSVDTIFQDSLSRQVGISKVFAQLLANRGLKTAQDAQRFLEAKAEYLLDPYSFSDMRKAVGLVNSVFEKKQKVMVFGDYDADGITALALVKETLDNKGMDVVHYLPHRVKEGYGLNKNILQLAREKNVKLLITVDCGSSNYKEIEELRRNNIEVIVTDHHEPQGQEPPPASCILNPKFKSSGYPYRDLAGVGVAYKLCQAVSDSAMLDDLDLVSLGTIADSVSLTGENRIIAKQGLLRLASTKRAGLRALMENAGIKSRKLNSTVVSFIIGPRINASGRMDSAEVSLNLLLSRSEEEAKGLADILEQHNRKRQKIESKILEEAQDLINKEVNFKEHKIIVIAKEDWHQGVLGIVASKLADRFYRPAIVISVGQDLCKGSARSIKSFHLFQALKESSQFLHTFGGHAHAAGLVITKESIEDFKRSINKFAHEKLTIEDLLPSIDIDLELSLADLNPKVIMELETLEPFGTGNPEPLFFTRNLKIRGEPQMLGRETLKFWASDGNLTYQVIGFGMSNLKDSLLNANSFDLVYTPRMDDWVEEPTIILEAKEMFFK